MSARKNELNDNAPANGQSVEDSAKAVGKPSAVQLRYLILGLDQPGGKLPLFDKDGQEIKAATIRSCVDKGWAVPWFNNPTMPNWIICKLTEAGRQAVK